MGLFGKKKTPAEMLAEGIELYNRGEYARASFLFMKVGGKESGEGNYWAGMAFLAMYDYHDNKPAIKRAKSFFKLAAEEGHAEAIKILAERFEIGEGADIVSGEEAKQEEPAPAAEAEQEKPVSEMKAVPTEEPEKEEPVLEMEAVPTEEPEPEFTKEEVYEKGIEFYRAQDYKEALSMFEKAAGKGHVKAQFNCGVMYSKGEGTKADKEKALKWYEKAGEQGDAKAQYCCGNMYYNGEGTGADKEKALKWYERAGEQGNVTAQYNCYVMYYNGEGTNPDREKALAWCRKAAEQGHEAALAFLNQKTVQTAAKAPEKAAELTKEEMYEKGMELFRAGDYDKAYVLLKNYKSKKEHPDGIVALGWMEENGYGTKKNAGMAHWYYKLAAQYGSKDGMEGMVRLLLKKTDPLQEECRKALLYIEQMGGDARQAAAVKQKLAEVQRKAAERAEQKKNEEECETLFHEGMKAYRSQDYVKALLMFEKAAEQGHVGAQFYCGVMYANGEGTKCDKGKALEWYEKAAEQGDAGAQFNCGGMYYNGEGTKCDKGKALEWYEKAAEQGDADAQFNCGGMYANGEGTKCDKGKALKWYEKAAEQGHAKAQFNCGVMYDKGEGTNCDKAKALEWYEKAAEQGHVGAQFNCGVMYSKGEGTNCDKAKALEWYEKVAEQGYADAQFNCGLMYYNGEGTNCDKGKALKWYEKAAEQGYAKAQIICGDMYYNGKGTNCDKAKALKWYEKAAFQTEDKEVQKLAKKGLEVLF